MTLLDVIKKAMRRDGLSDEQIERVLATSVKHIAVLAMLEVPPGEEEAFAAMLIVGKKVQKVAPLESMAIRTALRERLCSFNRPQQAKN